MTFEECARHGQLANGYSGKGCDLVRLRVSDVHLAVVSASDGHPTEKTARPVPVEITDPTREAFATWLALQDLRPSDWLFPSRGRWGDHLTTRHTVVWSTNGGADRPRSVFASTRRGRDRSKAERGLTTGAG